MGSSYVAAKLMFVLFLYPATGQYGNAEVVAKYKTSEACESASKMLTEEMPLHRNKCTPLPRGIGDQ